MVCCDHIIVPLSYVTHAWTHMCPRNIGPYSATKATIEALANTLAQELGGKGITVNTVHPGGIDTDVIYQNLTNHIRH
jgi:NAD(P)-dependent dehydrogenase (short-subunit alcohol dehydrogenase family)